MRSLHSPPTEPWAVTTAPTASLESAYRDLIPLCFLLSLHLFLPYKITLQPCVFVRGATFKHCVRFCIRKRIAYSMLKLAWSLNASGGLEAHSNAVKMCHVQGDIFSWISLPIEQFFELCITLLMPPCAQVCQYFHNTKPQLCFALQLPQYEDIINDCDLHGGGSMSIWM